MASSITNSILKMNLDNGSSLGIHLDVEKNGYNGSKYIAFVKKPYFFLSTEPSSKNFKEYRSLAENGFIRHCVPTHSGLFFDYMTHTMFNSLEEWYEDACRTSSCTLPLSSAIRFGRNCSVSYSDPIHYTISLEELVDRITRDDEACRSISLNELLLSA